jgi:hypothetical protein
MVAVLLLVCLVLAGAVVALVGTLRQMTSRLSAIERGLVTGTGAPSSTSEPLVEEVAQRPSRDQVEEYVITRLGDTDEPAPAMEASLFADVVMRESVVKAASWAYGVRRAFSPENRNRIRFEMRREVKRARKSRRAEEREAIREWRARQRQADAA